MRRDLPDVLSGSAGSCRPCCSFYGDLKQSGSCRSWAMKSVKKETDYQLETNATKSTKEQTKTPLNLLLDLNRIKIDNKIVRHLEIARTGGSLAGDLKTKNTY